MRILICSLQVSRGSSKGHLHPALEVGIELKHRGHDVGLLPLPSPLSNEDREQVNRCNLELITSPQMPEGLPFSAEVLAKLAKNEATTHLAFQSFLVTPFAFQFDVILKKVKQFKPDVIFYDLLVYAAPLAARLLSIPDVGYCAGLKLIASHNLTKNYYKMAEQLLPNVKKVFSHFSVETQFHNLELLSTTKNFVFTVPELIKESELPLNTILAGPLPISQSRCEVSSFDVNQLQNFIVLCFGSVMDPADYPDLTNNIISISKQYGLLTLVSTQKPAFFKDKEVITKDYLPLPQLLKKAKLIIHHGGANTFSEALSAGVAQLIIPLCNDQPIQAALLQQADAGIAIGLDKLSKDRLQNAFAKLLNQNDPVHEQIQKIKNLFTRRNGAVTAAKFIEKLRVTAL